MHSHWESRPTEKLNLLGAWSLLLSMLLQLLLVIVSAPDQAGLVQGTVPSNESNPMPFSFMESGVSVI